MKQLTEYPKTQAEFLTELQKFVLLGQHGTPEQQEEAREWFKDHVEVMGSKFVRKPNPAEKIRDFCQNMRDPRTIHEQHRVTQLKLDDAETAVAILNELTPPHHALATLTTYRRPRVRWLRAGKNLAQP